MIDIDTDRIRRNVLSTQEAAAVADEIDRLRAERDAAKATADDWGQVAAKIVARHEAAQARLATVEACYREIQTANQTAREFATRSARLAARLSVIADMAREGMDEFNDWSKPAATEPGGAR